MANRMYTPTMLRLSPQQAHDVAVQSIRDDWANFLFSMSEIVGKKIHWFGNPVNNEELIQSTIVSPRHKFIEDT